MQRKYLFILSVSFCLSLSAQAQDDLDIGNLPTLPSVYESGKLTKLVFYRYTKPTIEDGDTVWTYLMPELPVYPEMKFKNAKQRQQFNRLVANIKKVLPLAQKANQMLQETYEVLETLPDKQRR